VGQEKLQSYYKTNFALMQHHKYTLEDIENMIPFEREVYVMLLSQYVNEENTKIQERQSQMKANANKKRKV
jgi:hypothetical protein